MAIASFFGRNWFVTDSPLGTPISSRQVQQLRRWRQGGRLCLGRLHPWQAAGKLQWRRLEKGCGQLEKSIGFMAPKRRQKDAKVWNSVEPRDVSENMRLILPSSRFLTFAASFFAACYKPRVSMCGSENDDQPVVLGWPDESNELGEWLVSWLTNRQVATS